MEQDIERTKSAFAQANEKFTYPGVIYVEHANGNIAPVVVVEAENEYTEYSWDNQVTYNSDRHKYINSALKLAPHSQSEAKLFVINDATDEDIERVLTQASKNVKPPRPNQ
jgi:hypothetical protein